MMLTTDISKRIVLSVTDGSSEQVISIRSYATQQVERDPFDVEWSILDAAQAATAAPLYFDRFPATARQVSQSARVPTLRNMSTFFAGRRDQPEPEGRSYLIDAGFGIDNNPCNSILQEMKKINPASRPILVSIGTARPSHPEQEGRHRTLFKTVRRAFRTLGNPEKWHDHLEARAVEDDFSYYRFNSAGGLDIEMNEWKPKGGGQKTLKRMDAHFNAWVNEPGIEDQLRSCAEQLVKVRRARVKTDRARWERYALGRYFVCDHNGCDMQEQNHRYTDRSRFEKHLREHIKDENDIEAAVRRARKDWEYRTAPASNSP
ncbi:FabD/lysophospholipase-like protein [Apiospora arundinis]